MLDTWRNGGEGNETDDNEIKRTEMWKREMTGNKRKQPKVTKANVMKPHQRKRNKIQNRTFKKIIALLAT